jgi:hypothetical protein
MKMLAFWDVAPCSLVVVDRLFRGAYCLHHQGGAFNETAQRNIPEATIFILDAVKT